MTRRATSVLCLWLIWLSQAAVGEPFLVPGPGAATLGGTLGLLADDPTAAIWNPARLARLPRALHLVGGWQPSTKATSGFGAGSLRLGALRLAAWSALQDPPTGDERRTAWGGAGALDLGLVQLGLGVRRLGLKQGGLSAAGVGWDLGVNAGLLGLVSVGFVLQNALATRLVDEAGNVVRAFPPALRAGGALHLGGFTLAAEGEVSESGLNATRWGAQVSLIGLFAVRVGLDGGRWRWGLGVGTPGLFRLDLASLLEPEGTTWIFSTALAFDLPGLSP